MRYLTMVSVYRWQSSGLLRLVVFWLCTNVSEEHIASMFRAGVRRVRKSVRTRTGPEELVNQNQ
jgi:hypothetical protein